MTRVVLIRRKRRRSIKLVRKTPLSRDPNYCLRCKKIVKTKACNGWYFHYWGKHNRCLECGVVVGPEVPGILKNVSRIQPPALGLIQAREEFEAGQFQLANEEAVEFEDDV